MAIAIIIALTVLPLAVMVLSIVASRTMPDSEDWPIVMMFGMLVALIVMAILGTYLPVVL